MPSAVATTHPREGPSAAKKRRIAPPRQDRPTVSLPHPLNVKPAGNALFAAASTRNETLGGLARLSDDLILHILANYITDPRDLARLSRVSAGLRAFANFDSLWRNVFVEQVPGASLECWKGSWKQTFAQHIANGDSMIPTLAPVRPSHPFYSDSLYLPHRLSLLSLDFLTSSSSSSSRTCTPIPTVDADISIEDFHRQHASQHQPCIIRASSQRLKGLGIDIANLAQRYPERWIRAEAIRAKVKTYADYSKCCTMQQTAIQAANDINDVEDEEDGTVVPLYDPTAVPDESPYYLFDAQIPTQLALDDLWTVPWQIESCPSSSVYGFDPVTSAAASHVHADLFSLLGKTRPDHRWLIAGPAKSGSGWHKDPNYTSAWNTPLSGRKLWLMLPPDCPPPGVYVSEDGAEVTAPLSLAEWVSDFYQETQRVHGPVNRGGDGKLLQGICAPGETVYVPSGWWHLVVNLDESVALTQNFVSLAELADVLLFMKDKSDQISGFKLRQGERDDTDIEIGGANDDDDDLCDNAQEDPRTKLFDSFVSALSSYDANLAEWGLARMEALRHSSSKACSVRSVVEGKSRRSDTSGNSHGWWESLKTGGSEQSGLEGAQESSAVATFSLGSLLECEGGDDELGDVPW